MATPALAKHGSEYLKKTFLQPTIMGEVIPCLGVSEPAVKDGDDYVINGKKM